MASHNIMENPGLRLQMEDLVRNAQKSFVKALEEYDDKKFLVDAWTKSSGGHGISCVLEDGTIFEKAGVNISVVHGTLNKAAIMQMRANHPSIREEVDTLGFAAIGLSLILHPRNPMAPTVHFNCRFFDTNNESGGCWFGGGMDLTPTYLFEEDAYHFHKTLKEMCDKHNSTYYDRFKSWADEYYYNKHRGEARGIGGIFFDDLGAENVEDMSNSFQFVQDCVNSFLPAYIPIIERRNDEPFTKAEKDWQQIRRGRYVEFNLLEDRGTKFGLNGPNPRVESILMSLPLTARWTYKSEPPLESKENKLLEVLKTPRQWIV
jgi:coproporphyrinogen III oxidase